MLALCRRNRLRLGLGSPCDRDRADKAVALPWGCSDIALAAMAVAQGTAQRSDMDFEIAFIDESAGPKAVHRLALADQLAGTLRQGD